MLLRNGVDTDQERLNSVYNDFPLWSLERRRFVRLDYTEEKDVITSARLTPAGYEYLRSNPKLHNPIDWHRLLTTISVIITAANILSFAYIVLKGIFK